MNYELQKNNDQSIPSNKDESGIQDEKQNSEDDYQQIHNQDIINAQKSQESAKTESNFVSHYPENSSQHGSQKVQDPQSSNEEQQKLKNQERKLNTLYFVGVNSLLMNILLSFFIHICIQILVIALANTVTYIYLYEFNWAKQLFKYGSFSIQQQARSKITNKRIIVYFGILLCFGLIIVIVRFQDLKSQFYYLQTDVNQNYQRINHLQAQLRESDQIKNNKEIQRQEQMISLLQKQVNKLEKLAQSQSEDIQELKVKLFYYQRQQMSQSDQNDKQEQKSQKTHKQIDQECNN
ncbi:transmembrane protein, putative (macronuclear) [Tetrahymena thermophila SB210]|uniref:Transmembrane protein, putative n=1 Tax=Tetrahymena thermophila (strain SB210) TaxID=312017 RepID=Q23MH6_TETTS|nr:transmembrane protein, putative [Tetrahymena thermophila SB210]EAR97663.1 transmembrane protein, putative [Tetrahymena thermophila SB210]|eukprot:XP_001017908.1 transmembrane protein, putative [Tetrahymena thermophila SB210]